MILRRAPFQGSLAPALRGRGPGRGDRFGTGSRKHLHSRYSTHPLLVETSLDTAAIIPHVTTSDAEPGSASHQRPRALVMDDDPLFRTLLVAMLKRDYTVTAAADGSNGFYKALEAPPEM